MLRCLLACFLFVCFLLTGCLGPRYQPQQIDMPQSWRITTDEGSTLCNAKWWEQFNDPVLDSLILTALEYNQDLIFAIDRVYEYYARLGVVNANLYPEVDAFGSRTRNQSSLAFPTTVPGTQRVFNEFQGYFTLTWQLDFWGRYRSQSMAAYDDLLSQIEARRAVVVTVVTSVANAYFNLRALDAELEISRQTLKSRNESLKLANDRYNEGETSLIEVVQAATEVEIAAIRVLELERSIPQQENALSVLIGEYPHDMPRGKAVDTIDYDFTIPAGLPSDLITQRPDILEAEDKLIAANARVYEARTLFLPQFSLTGTYGNESVALHNFLTSPAIFWQYGTNIFQTVFDAGRTCYLVDEAIAVRAEILAGYRQTILTALQEVDDALIATQKNKELVLEHQKQVEILEEYLKLATLRYNEGEVDYLNVLDAERTLFDAQLSLAQSYADNLVAIVDLYGALGGGWVIDADEIAAADCP